MVIGAAPAVRAQDPAQGAVDFDLTRIDAVVSGDEEPVTLVARIRNTSDTALTGVRAVVTVRRRVTSRFTYHRALDAVTEEERGGRLGSVIGRAERPMEDIPAGQTRFAAVEALPSELGLATGRGNEGVHPVRFELHAESDEMAGLTSALVVTSDAPVQPLLGAMLVTIGFDVARLSQPQAGAGVQAGTAVEPVDSLNRLTEAVAQIDAPVNVAVDNAAAAMIPTLDGVGDLLVSPDVHRVVIPYAETDLVGLTAGGLEDVATTALRLGAAAWPATSAPAEPDVLLPAAGLDQTTLADVVAPSGTRSVVLEEEWLQIAEDRALPTSPSPVRPLATGDSREGEVAALVPDPWLAPLVAANPALGPQVVQRIVAETALMYLERPGAAEQRGVILHAPRRSSPEGLMRLMSALDDAPWLRLGTLEDVRRLVAPGPVTRLNSAAAREAALPDEYVAELEAAGETLTALAGVLTATDPGLERLRTDVLLAGSADFRGDLAAGRALLDSVTAVARDLLDAVTVVGQPTVTLTDSVGQLPIVLRNTAPVPLRVRIDLVSGRLRFPDNGLEVELASETTTTVLFDTEARTPGGTAPVDVTLTDPTGNRQLASGTVVVRIATYPALALILVAVTTLILVLWWVREVRRRRDPAPADAA